MKSYELLKKPSQPIQPPLHLLDYFWVPDQNISTIGITDKPLLSRSRLTNKITEFHLFGRKDLRK